MSKIHLDKHIHMGCRTIEEDFQYKWQPIDMKNFTAPKGKMFFVFGGNNTNRPDAANGNAKVIESLLSEENRKKSKIYSFVYDGEPMNSSTRFLYDDYREEAHEVYKKMIKPLFLDYVGNLKEQQGIEKVLKNIVFVSHCVGSNFVNVIIDDIYDTLIGKFHPSIAEHIMSKFQYYSYAPNVLPNYKVNGFIVAPFMDNDYSWAKVFDNVSEKRIDIDYPKGIMKKINKAQQQGDINPLFQDVFSKNRIMMLRSEESTYLIPGRLNSDHCIGDHSIDCLVKRSILEANTDCAKTAKILNSASKLALNQFVADYSNDYKLLFEKITKKIGVDSHICGVKREDDLRKISSNKSLN